MKKLSIGSRFKLLEKEIVGGYVNGIDIRFGFCLKIGISKPDDDAEPSALRQLELVFSNLADCNLRLRAHRSIRISDGFEFSKSTQPINKRKEQLQPQGSVLDPTTLCHFRVVFDVGNCEILAKDFALCELSTIPRVIPGKQIKP
ncbi:MAG: hypothetical protein AB7R40_25515 [Nitrospiraceae bacterium]